MCFSVCAEWIGLPVDCGRAGGREGGNSSSHGADLSKGCSADDGGRSAEGPRRCMGHLGILGGRRAVRGERCGGSGEREERGGRRGAGRGEGRCGGESQERGWEGDREQMGSEVRARRAAVAVSF